MTPDPRKPYHHGNLKEALVAAGIEILETEGIGALSLRAIAARVGVSHTAPKNHFGSLRGLLTAIAAEGFRRHAAFMRAGVAAQAGRKARLQAAMAGYVRFARDHRGLFELIFSPHHCNFDDPALSEAAEASYRVLSEIAEGLDWDKGQGAEGQRRSEMFLWSLVHGYAHLVNAGIVPGGAPGDVLDILPDFGHGLAPGKDQGGAALGQGGDGL